MSERRRSCTPRSHRCAFLKLIYYRRFEGGQAFGGGGQRREEIALGIVNHPLLPRYVAATSAVLASLVSFLVLTFRPKLIPMAAYLLPNDPDYRL